MFDLYCGASLVYHNVNSGFEYKYISAAVSSKILGQVMALLYDEVTGVTVNICLEWNLSNKLQGSFGWVEWWSVNLAAIFEFLFCIAIVKGDILLTLTELAVDPSEKLKCFFLKSPTKGKFFLCDEGCM